MKEKKILVYKLFLSLNISDFSLIFMKKLNSLKRSPLSFSVIPPPLPLAENGRGMGAYYVTGKSTILSLPY